MYELFKARAEAVSAEVYRFGSINEAVDFIIGFLKQEGVADEPGRRALWYGGPFLEGLDRDELMARAPGLGFEVNRAKAAACLIGITEMDWALADTGTVVQDGTAVEERLVSTLPEIHVALVAFGSILADLPALFERVDPGGIAYLGLITGPSRTADIERVLTIGVHGPRRVIIVCIDGEAGAAR